MCQFNIPSPIVFISVWSLQLIAVLCTGQCSSEFIATAVQMYILSLYETRNTLHITPNCVRTGFTLLSVLSLSLSLSQLQLLYFTDSLALPGILTMASASGAGQSSKSVRKSRNNSSHVHEEFVIVDQYHPGKKQFGPSSRCKHCQKIVSGTNATNLKTHLKSSHNDIFVKVKGRF